MPNVQGGGMAMGESRIDRVEEEPSFSNAEDRGETETQEGMGETEQSEHLSVEFI